MHTAFVIAKNTFRETIRDRIFYGIVGFGTLYILFTLFLGELSLGNTVMIKSFGLAGIYLFGTIITIFLGASIIDKEIEKRTLYFVLSKPVSRNAIIIGKFIGLYAAIALTLIFMVIVYAGVLWYANLSITLLELLAVFFQLLEMGLFVAMLIFFSTLAKPLIATIAATVILFAGHLIASALRNTERMSTVTKKFIAALYHVIPNLEKFNIRNFVVHALGPSETEVFLTILYAMVYTALFLAAALLLFKRKEL